MTGTGADIHVDGDENLRRTMGNAEADMEDLDLSGQARLVQSRAAMRAPKRSGTLSRSIHAKDLGKGAVAVSSELVYAPVQNYGWAAHNIRAHHFMESALADSRDLVVAETQRQVQGTLRQVKGV